MLNYSFLLLSNFDLGLIFAFSAPVFLIFLFSFLIIVSALYLTKNYRATARKNREARRHARDEALKKELERISRCEVTLIFCYDDKVKTLVHKKNFVFNPDFPSREGYSFDGWYTDSARTTPFQNKAITDNLTLYAKWTKEAD